MKKLLFTQLMLLLTIPLIIMSCGDDDNPGPVELVPEMDGVYVFGTNTVAEASVDPAARMSLATLNPAKSDGAENLEGYYGRLIYIGANSTIQITEVEGENAFTYGAEGGGTVSHGSEIQFTDMDTEFIHGALVDGGEPIKVTEEGLYYLFVNTVDDQFRLMKLEPQMFGDTQPGQWETGTELPLVSASAEGAVFEVNALDLNGESGYKWRFNKGYEVFNNNEIATLTFLGVESYGEAWDSGVNDLIYKDENIPHHESGIFTVRLEYDAATGEWSEKKSRDYSTTEIGLFGNAYYKAEGVQGDWTDPYQVHGPEKDGAVYSWTWDNVELIQDGEFVILENGAWGGMAVLYNDATERAGDAFSNNQIIQGTGSENFFVAVGGTYDMSLAINVDTGVRTLTLNPAE